MLMPKQYEIKQYLNDVSDKYGLTPKMHFNTEVEQCTWNSETATWTIDLHDTQTDQRWQHETSILFSCAGSLVNPRKLDVPGVELFKGPIFHTAQWDNSVDLENKKVIVIGNGCTGIQVVTGVLNLGAKSVVHFSRSPHWILPSPDRPINEPVRWLLQKFPFLMWLFRFYAFMYMEKAALMYDMTKRGARDRAMRQAISRRYIKKVAPKNYRSLLIPDWELGCRRRIFDCGYIEALNRPDLELTNSTIKEITSNGVRTEEGVIEADAIILANGFEVSKYMAPMTLKGKNGVDIHEQWDHQGGIGAYSCVAVSGFPNFFLVAGPNTATGHTSVVISSENTTNLALRLLKPVLDGKAKTVEVRKEAEERWSDQIQDALQNRVWTRGGCTSWYVEDSKWVSTMYPYSQADLWKRCMFPKWSDWEYRADDGKEVSYYGLDRFKKLSMYILGLASIGIWYIRRV
ncbi:putative monooxygenase [Phaeomoniella chlamydospora]|uniref:Putative monooxygenase n=1 Tax=Phaeomoniella chlamydospora TaxID=158046 RepID=A0A0G2F2E7_PHACM|nr:putative monooxygenase [Phaeomoniella chlamydospora]